MKKQLLDIAIAIGIGSTSIMQTASGGTFVKSTPSAESALDVTGSFIAAYNYGDQAAAITLGDAAFTVPASLPSGWANEGANNAWGLTGGSDFQNLVNSFAGSYGGGTPITHTFAVTSGSQYKVQFVVARGNPLNMGFALSNAYSDSYNFNGVGGTGTSYTLIANTFTATSNSLTVTVTANDISALNGFTLEDLGVPPIPIVDMPTFNLAPGTYSGAQSVTISTTTSDASIRYTTDGSTPTSSSGTEYSTPVTISTLGTTTLKAIAYKADMTDSSVRSGDYTITNFVKSSPNAESALDVTGSFIAAYNYGDQAAAFTLGNAAFTVPASLPSGWANESGNNAWGLTGGDNFQNLVNSFAGSYGGGTPISHTFAVTSGSQYKVQFVVARGNNLNMGFALSGACSDSYNFNGIGGTGTSYTLITNTFTATSNSLTVTATANDISALNGFTLEALDPPTGGYAGWTSANGASGQAADLDHDNDGVPNGVEYFLAGTTDSTGFNALPGVDTNGSTHSVTWTMASTYTGTYEDINGYVVETSETLTGNWAPAPLGALHEAGKVYIDGYNVTYTFPAGPLMNFVRLKVNGQ
jgi:hypothetical protein